MKFLATFLIIFVVYADFNLPRCDRENKELLECGPACPITCENYDNPPKFCTMQCVKGCFCKKGYYRASDESCVSEEYCFWCNSEREEYIECGSACPATCENYNIPIPCTLQCVFGCFCKKQYVRGPDGLCILPKYCYS
ncbi:cysteine-rich venom protein 6-like [Centruroides vittatus]|uniref:cysteine-rich venom protein 6-like n=1 Tax=Centruroides vittatus TaxID=120091 RepID=UPI00350FBEAF